MEDSTPSSGVQLVAAFDSFFTRADVLIQFTSQVLPPSSTRLTAARICQAIDSTPRPVAREVALRRGSRQVPRLRQPAEHRSTVTTHRSELLSQSFR